jgi:hypothetical protein
MFNIINSLISDSIQNIFHNKIFSRSQFQHISLLSLFDSLLDNSNQSFPIDSKILSSLDPTIQSNQFKLIHEFFSSFSNKFEKLIKIFDENITFHFGKN